MWLVWGGEKKEEGRKEEEEEEILKDRGKREWDTCDMKTESGAIWGEEWDQQERGKKAGGQWETRVDQNKAWWHRGVKTAQCNPLYANLKQKDREKLFHSCVCAHVMSGTTHGAGFPGVVKDTPCG